MPEKSIVESVLVVSVINVDPEYNPTVYGNDVDVPLKEILPLLFPHVVPLTDVTFKQPPLDTNAFI